AAEGCPNQGFGGGLWCHHKDPMQKCAGTDESRLLRSIMKSRTDYCKQISEKNEKMDVTKHFFHYSHC
ncbi:hypothetical protein, partial [Sulfitobacter indolifex]|uniref:hypothetical protein n=1 Tax=Sulfitobacter indolifex TaxID=225422 RepID=UPI001AD82731